MICTSYARGQKSHNSVPSIRLLSATFPTGTSAMSVAWGVAEVGAYGRVAHVTLLTSLWLHHRPRLKSLPRTVASLSLTPSPAWFLAPCPCPAPRLVLFDP